MSDELQHYGRKRRSGRYPWGSGKDPQRSRDILSEVDSLRRKGMSEKEVAEALGMNTSKLRSEIAWANKERKEAIMESIQSMKKRGLTNTEIASKLDIAESSVRNYMTQADKNKIKQLDNVVDALKTSVGDGYLDIGAGTEIQMGISKEKLKNAVAKMKEEGYVEHEIYVKRLNDPSKYTTVKVLTKEKDLEVVKKNSDKIKTVESYTEDGAMTPFKHIEKPKNVGWNRVQIKYGDKGGEDMDGVIEIRRGKKDLDLGQSKYAQVRIAVGGTHYLKGMAIYTDDLPDGVDIRFNTNKKSGTPKKEVLKKLKDNEFNPFGATINRQSGALNIVNEEGDWGKWAATLSSQFLSKQPTNLIKDRLSATYKKALSDFDEIKNLTNPIVKKHLMEAYANELESKTRHLKALGLPRTKGHVILPLTKLKANEVYAPNYNNGEKVVLVRYPHGGTFELPELTVNNKNKQGRSIIGNAIDGIGIHPSVAGKLSGADFDGDTVFVIPNKHKKIKTSRSLKELENFKTTDYYAGGKTTISPKYKQIQMGIVSNLITDMTIKNATQSEIAHAVKHSMVVIDSEKHKLDWKKSARDNGISALQKKYQHHISSVDDKPHTAASTLISRSKKTVDTTYTNPKTGKKKVISTPVIDVVYNKYGNVNSLSSGTQVENLYADYVNKLKATGNKARKVVATIPPVQRNKEAARVYSKEVKSLETKLNVALANAPRERQAQIKAANAYYKNLDYSMSPDQKKKLKTQVTAEARVKSGSKKKLVDITDREWEAIQAGAISNDKLEKILRNADMDKVKKLATPKQPKVLSSGKLSRAKTLLDNGYTYAEVAEAMGVSTTTLRNNLGGR
ncbi:TPA: hypothetical protein SIF56_004462 [Escherichia coli]|nr:hypothetical protein [Escherichia coli]